MPNVEVSSDQQPKSNKLSRRDFLRGLGLTTLTAVSTACARPLEKPIDSERLRINMEVALHNTHTDAIRQFLREEERKPMGEKYLSSGGVFQWPQEIQLYLDGVVERVKGLADDILGQPTSGFRNLYPDGIVPIYPGERTLGALGDYQFNKNDKTPPGIYIDFDMGGWEDTVANLYAAAYWGEGENYEDLFSGVEPTVQNEPPVLNPEFSRRILTYAHLRQRGWLIDNTKSQELFTVLDTPSLFKPSQCFQEEGFFEKHPSFFKDYLESALTWKTEAVQFDEEDHREIARKILLEDYDGDKFS